MKAILTLLFVFALSVSVGAVEAPNLVSIQTTIRAKPLTNARVLRSSATSVTFACDQGIVQVPFEALPPEFAYYKVADKPALVVQAAPKVAPPTLKAPTNPVPKPKSAVDEAKQAKENADRKAALLAKVASLEALMDRYDRQSSFSGQVLISTEEYNLAKAQRDEAKAKLAGMQ